MSEKIIKLKCPETDCPYTCNMTIPEEMEYDQVEPKPTCEIHTETTLVLDEE